VHVDLKEAEGPRLLPLLISDGLDAVFCRQPSQLPEPFVFESLLADEAVFVVAARHPLATSRRVPLAALGDTRWVLPISNIAVRDIFERVVLAQLPQAVVSGGHRVAAGAAGVAGPAQALGLVPRSIAHGLVQAQDAGGIQMLDVRVDPAQRSLAPLGAVPQKAPLLREMLALWRAAPVAAVSAAAVTHHQVVAHGAHALDGAGDFLGAGALGRALGKSAQGHFAVQGLHVDGAGVDLLVGHELGLDFGGDGRIVDVGAGRFLAAHDEAAGGGSGQGHAHGGGDDQGADSVHGELAWVLDFGTNVLTVLQRLRRPSSSASAAPAAAAMAMDWSGFSAT
jgi:hypothetical protein